jgi:polysaccharide pyruvyl transferase WcaK-like protein
MKKKPIIGIIGASISGNRGAEAMTITVIGELREKFPDAEFKIFSYYPKQDRNLVTQPYVDILSCTPASLVLRFFPFACLEWLVSRFGMHLPDRLLTRVISVLRSCDVLVDISGVSFVGGREIFLPFNILTIWPAMLLGVPVVKMAQALGPFKNPINRMTAKLFLPPCNHVFARGLTTEKHLQELNLKNVSRTTDVAFLCKPEYSLTSENEAKNEAVEKQLLALKASGKKIIALAPSSVVYKSSLKVGKDYIQSLLDMISQFDQEEVYFLVLPQSNREISQKSRNNDLNVLRTLRYRARMSLPDYLYQRMNWILWDVNTRSLRKLIDQCDLLMTSRFHAMIAGLSLGVPVLVIGWSHKYLETLADFGLEKYNADFDDANVNLAELAKDLLNNHDQISAKILVDLEHVQKLSEGQFSYLESLINEESPLA